MEFQSSLGNSLSHCLPWKDWDMKLPMTVQLWPSGSFFNRLWDIVCVFFCESKMEKTIQFPSQHAESWFMSHCHLLLHSWFTKFLQCLQLMLMALHDIDFVTSGNLMTGILKKEGKLEMNHMFLFQCQSPDLQQELSDSVAIVNVSCDTIGFVPHAPRLLCGFPQMELDKQKWHHVAGCSQHPLSIESSLLMSVETDKQKCLAQAKGEKCIRMDV